MKELLHFCNLFLNILNSKYVLLRFMRRVVTEARTESRPLFEDFLIFSLYTVPIAR